jgi:hypothetical protein
MINYLYGREDQGEGEKVGGLEGENQRGRERREDQREGGRIRGGGREGGRIRGSMSWQDWEGDQLVILCNCLL